MFTFLGVSDSGFSRVWEDVLVRVQTRAPSIHLATTHGFIMFPFAPGDFVMFMIFSALALPWAHDAHDYSFAWQPERSFSHSAMMVMPPLGNDAFLWVDLEVIMMLMMFS